MKVKIIKISFFAFILSASLSAQPNGPVNPTPIGGIPFLIAGAVALGAAGRKHLNRREEE